MKLTLLCSLLLGGLSGQTDNDPHVTVHRTPISEPVRSARQAYPEGHVELRGFRAPILGRAAVREPFTPPPDGPIRRAARIVGRQLARDGLLRTTTAVLESLGAKAFAGLEPTPDQMNQLRLTGIPLDLLGYFSIPEHDTRGMAIIPFLAGRLGIDRAEAFRFAESAEFSPRATRAGFRVATESGEHEIGTIRLQLTRGTYWRGPGAGGCLDITRQLFESLEGTRFIASIEEQHLKAFLRLASEWKAPPGTSMRLLPEPLTVSQWAQDNAKAGLLIEPNGKQQIATLVPRYASRGETGSVFVPGESFLIDQFAELDHPVIHSPLIFQGGSLLAVRDPATQERILLIGEAEIYRNTAMGLSRAQAVEAFRVEFGVDRCVVLPAASFHVDFDVTCRAVDDKVVAFVNDSEAAVRMILKLGIQALHANRHLTDDNARTASDAVRDGNPEAFLQVVGKALSAQADANGHFELSFARVFSAGPPDSPVGNLQRFLLAMDMLVGEVSQPRNSHAAAYVRSFKRRESDHQALRKILNGLGWEVVGIPSLANGNRSLNYLNGIHTRSRYLMPAYGGFFAPLDEAAQAAFGRRLGPGIQVLPILSGESQRRVGAVHCSAAAYPLLD